jgi:hypothetical protein
MTGAAPGAARSLPAPCSHTPLWPTWHYAGRMQPERRRRPAGERVEQARRAVALRRRGATSAMIASDLGVPLRTAKRRVAEGYQLEQGDGDAPDTLRREVEDRLDQAMRRVQRRLAEPGLPQAQEQRWTRLLLAIEAQRARLLGLNLPSVVVVRSEVAERAAGGVDDDGDDGAGQV